MEGIIERVKKNFSEKFQKEYYTVLINGKWLKSYDTRIPLLEKCKVSYEISDTGNMVKLSKIENPKEEITHTTQPNPVRKASQKTDPMNECVRIASMAIAYAKDLVVSEKVPLENFYSEAEKICISIVSMATAIKIRIDQKQEDEEKN